MSIKDPLWDRARLIITVVMVLVAFAALLQALAFRPLAGYFPIAAAGMVVVFGIGQLIRDLRNYMAGRSVVIQGMDVDSPLHGLGLPGLLVASRYIGWFIGYIVLFYLAGVFVSGIVFVAAFLRLEARWSWAGSALLALGVGLVSGIMVRGLGLDLPSTLLEIGHDLVL